MCYFVSYVKRNCVSALVLKGKRNLGDMRRCEYLKLYYVQCMCVMMTMMRTFSGSSPWIFMTGTEEEEEQD